MTFLWFLLLVLYVCATYFLIGFLVFLVQKPLYRVLNWVGKLSSPCYRALENLCLFLALPYVMVFDPD